VRLSTAVPGTRLSGSQRGPEAIGTPRVSSRASLYYG
jgi:hypothetical protein